MPLSDPAAANDGGGVEKESGRSPGHSGTKEQALIGGAVSGILEGVFEKVSLGQLEAMCDRSPQKRDCHAGTTWTVRKRSLEGVTYAG